MNNKQNTKKKQNGGKKIFGGNTETIIGVVIVLLVLGLAYYFRENISQMFSSGETKVETNVSIKTNNVEMDPLKNKLGIFDKTVLSNTPVEKKLDPAFKQELFKGGFRKLR